MIGAAGTDTVQEALQELQADVARLAPAVNQALVRCRRDDPLAWENLNAYDVLTLDLFLTFISLATSDHEITEAEQRIINTVGSAMEAGAGCGASELYRRAWKRCLQRVTMSAPAAFLYCETTMTAYTRPIAEWRQGYPYMASPVL